LSIIFTEIRQVNIYRSGNQQVKILALFWHSKFQNAKRMKTIFSIVFLHLFLFQGVQLNAQEKWMLNECISYGLKNNLKLNNARLSEEIVKQDYRQSKFNLLPGIGAGADAGRNYGRSVDPNTNGIITTSFFNNSYYLGASVDVFKGMMLQNQIRYQKFRKEAAQNYRENATDDLAFEIMDAFYSVIYQQELLKIANEQKEISELNLKKMEILVSTGLKAPTDLLEVKANFEKDELFCIQTNNNIEAAWIKLKKAMNLPADQQIEITSGEEQPVEESALSADVPELYKEYCSWSPYLRQYENELKASEKIVSIRKAGYYPSVRLQASYNTGFYETNKDESEKTIAFNDQIKNNQSQFVGATLSIPIFSKNSVRTDVKQSKLAMEQAQTTLEQTRQTLIYEMEQNYNELTASWKELQQSEKQLEADKLAFEASQKKFNQGLINVVEFYTVKTRLASTTNQVLHSKLVLEMKKRIFDFYRGKRFWESPL
jgi:outer membrane protein